MLIEIAAGFWVWVRLIGESSTYTQLIPTPKTRELRAQVFLGPGPAEPRLGAFFTNI